MHSSYTAPIRSTSTTSRRPYRKVPRLAHIVWSLCLLASSALPLVEASQGKTSVSYVSVTQGTHVSYERIEIKMGDDRQQCRSSLYHRLSSRYQLRCWILLYSLRRWTWNAQYMFRPRRVSREESNNGTAHRVAYLIRQVWRPHEETSAGLRGRRYQEINTKALECFVQPTYQVGGDQKFPTFQSFVHELRRRLSRTYICSRIGGAHCAWLRGQRLLLAKAMGTTLSLSYSTSREIIGKLVTK